MKITQKILLTVLAMTLPLSASYTLDDGSTTPLASGTYTSVTIEDGTLQVNSGDNLSGATTTFNASGGDPAILEVTGDVDPGILDLETDGIIQVDSGNTATLSQVPVISGARGDIIQNRYRHNRCVFRFEHFKSTHYSFSRDFGSGGCW